MIYSRNLRFACEHCVNANRAFICNHYDSIPDGIIYVIQDNRGIQTSNSFVLKLHDGTPDPRKNRRCPRTGNYCFKCMPGCCGRCDHVYLLEETVRVHAKFMPCDMYSLIDALPKSSFDKKTDYLKDARVYCNSEGEELPRIDSEFDSEDDWY